MAFILYSPRPHQFLVSAWIFFSLLLQLNQPIYQFKRNKTKKKVYYICDCGAITISGRHVLYHVSLFCTIFCILTLFFFALLRLIFFSLCTVNNKVTLKLMGNYLEWKVPRGNHRLTIEEKKKTAFGFFVLAKNGARTRRFSDYWGVKHAIRTEYGELLMICMTAINPFLTFLFPVPMKRNPTPNYSIINYVSLLAALSYANQYN